MTTEELNNIVKNVVADVAGVQGITLQQANRLCEALIKKAAQIGVNAVVAIANAAANPVCVQCMDNSYIASYDIAFNKAYTAVALKMSTAKLNQMAAPGGSLYGIQNLCGGKIVVFGGGVPLYNKDGILIGGLGVSGGSESEDTGLAEYGSSIISSVL